MSTQASGGAEVSQPSERRSPVHGLRRWIAVFLRFLLAYFVLVLCWMVEPVSDSAFAWIGSPKWTRFLGTPAQFEWLARVTGLGWLKLLPDGLARIVHTLWPSPVSVLNRDPTAQLQRTVWWLWTDTLTTVLGLGVVPVLLCLILGLRSRQALGLRWPTATPWRALGIAYAATLPVLVVAATHPAFKQSVQLALPATVWFPVNLLVSYLFEHLFFNGILLAWLHPTGRFPPSEEVARPIAPLWVRRADGLRVNLRALVVSLGVPRACLPAIVLSGPLFWAIHAGKSDAEYWLSLPTGMVLAWLAYRTNGPVLPFVLHMIAGLTAGGIGLAVLGG